MTKHPYYKSPGITIYEGYEEYKPSIDKYTHQQLLDYIPFEVIERYVRQRKLKNIDEEDKQK